MAFNKKSRLVMPKEQGRNYVHPNWEYAKKHGWAAKQVALKRGDETTVIALHKLITEGQKEIDYWKEKARLLAEECAGS